MVAERDIGQGEEVTHRYDDVIDAADYLERYGFAPYRDVLKSIHGRGHR